MIRLACIVLLVAASGVSAQQPRPVSGRVLDAGTGAPLARAAVTTYLAFAEDRPSIRILTDDRGSFHLPPGEPAFLHVSKAGYATLVIAVPRERDGELEVPLVRGAAISGRVVDVTGRPVAGALVRAAPVGTRDPTIATPSFFTARTDERGEYRIGGLVSGRYEVTAVDARFDASADVGLQTARLRQGAPLALDTVGTRQRLDVAPGGEAVASDLTVETRLESCGFTSPIVDESARGVIRGRVTAATGGRWHRAVRQGDAAAAGCAAAGARDERRCGRLVRVPRPACRHLRHRGLGAAVRRERGTRRAGHRPAHRRHDALAAAASRHHRHRRGRTRRARAGRGPARDAVTPG
jgi:hypothetical protein